MQTLTTEVDNKYESNTMNIQTRTFSKLSLDKIITKDKWMWRESLFKTNLERTQTVALNFTFENIAYFGAKAGHLCQSVLSIENTDKAKVFTVINYVWHKAANMVNLIKIKLNMWHRVCDNCLESFFVSLFKLCASFIRKAFLVFMHVILISSHIPFFRPYSLYYFSLLSSIFLYVI